MSRLPSLLADNRPLLMGVLNVTPDSFSDGGQFLDPEIAVARALEMTAQGADIIDIGGESTRPGAQAISAGEEIDRIMPVVSALRANSDIAISLDTSKAAVIQAALGKDVDLINDVRALREADCLMAAANSQLPVCLMHMRGEPRTMQKKPVYVDLIAELITFFEQRITACESAGIDRARIILDIGFGFGKTPEHNLILINRLREFTQLGLPLLVGLSRKSTIGAIVDDRISGSIGGALAALKNGAKILRVHDVAQTMAAVKVWRSIAEERLVG
jgi:dihydropteroate synthase